MHFFKSMQFMPGLPGATQSSFFLFEVKDSFFSNAQWWRDASGWLIGLGAAIACILALMLIKKFLNRKVAYIPPGWVSDPKQILYVLEMALEQRRTFEIQFSSDKSQRRPVLRCSPDEVSGRVLAVIADGLSDAAFSWVDREVEGYFRISVKKQDIHYAFSTIITKVENYGKTRSKIVLRLPEKLENRQKRAFLRISPPEEYVLGAALWHQSNRPDGQSMLDIIKWPAPSLTFLPDTVMQFILGDISAGGIRISIPKQELIKAGLEFSVSDRIILLLDLLDPDERRRSRFWLNCRVQNLAVAFESQSLDLGLQFLEWARVKDGASTEVEWFKLGANNEVDPLGNWIIRRHLETFREHAGAGLAQGGQ